MSLERRRDARRLCVDAHLFEVQLITLTNKPLDMRTHVAWPLANERVEALAIASKECARGFFKAREVACHGPHELACCVACGMLALRLAHVLARLFDELAQCDRDATGLPLKPGPVTWQE